jgi:BirA family biotin operon repressor/biotin-[acetyl-CoA-carboxylase] ligase
MPFDIDRILRETFLAQMEHCPSVGSTNDRAAELAKAQDASLPLLVSADHQTAGRGRGSNRWWTGPGALVFSMAVDPAMVGADHGPAPMVSLAVGVAVVEAIVPMLPEQQIGLHWPNDVMVAGRKVAGILVEVLPQRQHVIGIGLNTNNTMADAPAELQERAATFRDLTGGTFDETEVLTAMLTRLEIAFATLRADPRCIAARANQLCLQHGRKLTIERGDAIVTGECCGINEDGALLLETPSGVEAFYSGVLRKP